MEQLKMAKTITTTYYTLAELEELVGGQAVDNAYEALSEMALDNAQEYDGDEIVNSLMAFAELFGTKLTSWSFNVNLLSGYYNYANVDVEAFKNLTNEEKNDSIKEWRELVETDIWNLTGVYSDAYILKAVTEEVGEITFNNVVRALENVPGLAMYEFSRAVNENAYDRDNLYEMAEGNEWYFDVNGKFKGIM